MIMKAPLSLKWAQSLFGGDIVHDFVTRRISENMTSTKTYEIRTLNDEFIICDEMQMTEDPHGFYIGNAIEPKTGKRYSIKIFKHFIKTIKEIDTISR